MLIHKRVKCKADFANKTLKSWQVEANSIRHMSIPCHYHWKIKKTSSINAQMRPAASFILAYFSLTLMACSRSKIKSCASSMPTDSLTQHGQGASSLHFQEYLEILKTSSRTKLHVEEFMLLEKHDWIEDIESFLWLLSISISNVFESHEKVSETTIFNESN